MTRAKVVSADVMRKRIVVYVAKCKHPTYLGAISRCGGKRHQQEAGVVLVNLISANKINLNGQSLAIAA